MKKKILFPLILVLLAGCATTPKLFNEAADPQEYFPDFGLSIGYDAFDTRLNLYKQEITETKTTTDSSGNTQTTTETKEKRDSMLAVGIGHGLYIDINGNIFLQPLDVFGINTSDSFQLEVRRKRIIGDAVRRIKSDGSSFSEEMGNEKLNNFSTAVSGTIGTDRIEIDNVFGTHTITRTDEGFQYRGTGLNRVFEGTPQEFSLRDGVVYVKSNLPAFKDEKEKPFAEQTSRDTIDVKKIYTITRSGNAIHIEPHYSFFRKLQSFFIYDRTIDIIFEADTINIFVNGRLRNEVLIEGNSLTAVKGPDYNWTYRLVGD